jgi:hypothetical protein
MGKKCCKTIKKIIKECDCFGTFISFRINDEIEYKSLIGGFSTIIFTSFALAYTLYVSYYFISRKNVDLIYSNKIIQSNPQVNLTQLEFNFGFGLQYQSDGESAVNLKYFKYNLSLCSWTDDEQLVYTNIPYRLCEKKDFFNIVNESFDIVGLGDMLCPELSNINFTLSGTFMDYFYQFIELNIELTNYALENKEETKNFIINNPLEMAFFFLDNAIDYESRKNTLPIYLNYLFKAMDFEFQKTTETLISKIEFSNDENIIFNNPKMSYGATLDSHFDSFHKITDKQGDNLIGQLLIKASPKVIQLSRTYEKLPSFIADLSGILEEILIITLFLVNIIERQAIDNKLIHTMLKYKGSKHFDIDYFVSLYKKNKIYSNVMEIIKRPELTIEKGTSGKIRSPRKSVMTLLDNKSIKRSGNLNIFHLENNSNNYLNYDDLKLNANENNSRLHSKNIEVTLKERDNFELLNKEQKYKKESFSIESISSITEDRNKNQNDSLEKNDDERLSQSKNSNRLSSQNSTLQEIKKENDKLKDIKLGDIGIMKSLYKKLCKCFKNNKLEYEFIKSAEDKIHYYFDVYTYIKNMQTVDLLTYSLFNKDQIILFDYLAKPPLRTNLQSNEIYNEFDERQITYKKVGKEEINKLYEAFNNIRNKEEILFEDLKLMRLVNAEIRLFD